MPRISSRSKEVGSPKELVHYFLQMLATIKLYHWKTRNYGQHIASDKLYADLSENVDKFVEVWQGKQHSRFRTSSPFIVEPAENDMVDTVTDYIRQLNSLEITYKLSDQKDGDLLNIRDEMVAQLNQFLYLISFD